MRWTILAEDKATNKDELFKDMSTISSIDISKIRDHTKSFKIYADLELDMATIPLKLDACVGTMGMKENTFLLNLAFDQSKR